MSEDNSMPTPLTRVNTIAEGRAREAWALRVAGIPWARIAAITGYHDDAGAIRAVRRYAGTLPVVERETSRQLWRERLELLWTQAAADVAEQRPGAVRAAIALAQRAAQLDSLDEPTELRITPTTEEFGTVVGQLVAWRRAQLGVAEVAEEADVFADEED